MFKILTTASLFLASFAIRMDASHEQTFSAVTTLNDEQSQWDKFYRDSIKALGDSAAKEIATTNGQTIIKYLDTTGNNGEVVGWEVTGNNDKNNRRVEKVVQVKTTPDPNNKAVNTVTKTTFQRNNLLDVSKTEYAA